MDWVEQIVNVPIEKKYAQFGEEAIFDFIFENIQTTDNYLVDLGAGGLGCKMSNTQYLIEKGWSGLRIDGNTDPNSDIKKEFITTENIIHLFEKYRVPETFDLLSIDIDGNDFWVLKNIFDGGYYPRVIINEFNGCIEQGVSKVMKNNPTHSWGNNDYYGASFEAFNKLCRSYGYVLIYQVATTNMIFVKRESVLKKDYSITYTQNQYHPHSPNREWIMF